MITSTTPKSYRFASQKSRDTQIIERVEVKHESIMMPTEKREALMPLDDVEFKPYSFLQPWQAMQQLLHLINSGALHTSQLPTTPIERDIYTYITIPSPLSPLNKNRASNKS